MAPHDTSDHGNASAAEVIVDGTPQKVPEGSYLVSELKQLVGVDGAKELEQIVEGRLVPLDDKAAIVIERGGLRFVSHTRRGGSS